MTERAGSPRSPTTLGGSASHVVLGRRLYATAKGLPNIRLAESYLRRLTLKDAATAAPWRSGTGASALSSLCWLAGGMSFA